MWRGGFSPQSGYSALPLKFLLARSREAYCTPQHTQHSPRSLPMKIDHCSSPLNLLTFFRMALNEKNQPARNTKTLNSEQKSKLPSVGAGVKTNLPTKNLVWSR